MSMRWGLSRKDLQDAVALLAQQRGYAIKGDLSVSVSKGDRPFDSEEVGASIEVEEMPALKNNVSGTYSISLEAGYPVLRSHFSQEDQVSFIRGQIARRADSFYADVYPDGSLHVGRVWRSATDKRPAWLE